MNIKKQYGINIDGMGNLVKSKKEQAAKANEPQNINALMFQNKSINVSATARKEKKEYKQISTYKPTGLIYNNALLKKIEDKTKN